MKKTKTALSYPAAELLEATAAVARLLTKTVTGKTIVDIVRALAELPVGETWQEREKIHSSLDSRLAELFETAAKMSRSPWQYFEASKPEASKPKTVSKPKVSKPKTVSKPKAAKASKPPEVSKASKPKAASKPRASKRFEALTRPARLAKPEASKPETPASGRKEPAAQGLRREEEKKILEALESSSAGVSIARLVQQTRLDPATIKSRLKSLKRSGSVHCSGTRRNGLWHAGSAPPASAPARRGAPLWDDESDESDASLATAGEDDLARDDLRLHAALWAERSGEFNEP